MRAAERQRQRYARMRRTDRHGEELGATEQDEHGEVAADGRSDAGLTAGGHPDEGRDR